MSITSEQIDVWIGSIENEVLEFKESRRGLNFDELARYCAAIANDGGGYLIIGVSDKRPRQVTGTDGYQAEHLQKTKFDLTKELRLKIEVHEVDHKDGRVVVFRVPSRPLGVPIRYKGKFYMRSGESLTEMTDDRLRELYDEAVQDFSAEICKKAIRTDLDDSALELLKQKWHKKSENDAILAMSYDQILSDLDLVDEDGITYAALILCGSRKALRKHLASAEVIFEYRSDEGSISYQERQEYRDSFLLYENQLWEAINKRNDIQEYQIGFTRGSIVTFNEAIVREAILNAISHREYWSPESVFIRQFPRKLEVVSPGGLPKGVTVENITWKQAPRNRLLAETLAKCGYVERSGQGADVMFRESIKESKPSPDFTGTEESQVFLTLRCEVQDPNFVRFIEKIGQERLKQFTTDDFLTLDYVHRKLPVPERLRPRLTFLVAHGVLERVGRRYFLSRGFYEFMGKSGEYTRERGLDRETNKALLERHIIDNVATGSRLQELMQVLPSLSETQVQGLIYDLRDEKRIHSVGKTRGAKWLPGPDPRDLEDEGDSAVTQ